MSKAFVGFIEADIADNLNFKLERGLDKLFYLYLEPCVFLKLVDIWYVLLGNISNILLSD